MLHTGVSFTQHLLEKSVSPQKISLKTKGDILEIEKLIHRAFHLRRSIDALEDGQEKHRMVKRYARIIWQIQDYYTGK